MLRLILFSLVSGLTAHAMPGLGAPSCDVPLTRPRMSRKDLDRAIKASPAQFSQRHLVTFTTEGLPELDRLARENEITIAELLKDVRAALVLIVESGVWTPDSASAIRLGIGHLESLEPLMGRTKFKAPHHLKLKTVLYALDVLALELAKAEIKRCGSCVNGPKELLGREGIRTLMAAVEDGRLDDALLGFEKYRGRRERWLEYKWLMDHVKPERPRPETLPAPLPPLEDEPVDSGSVDAEVARLAPPPIVLPEAPTVETNLAVVLGEALPLLPHVDYEVQTARGTDLTVTLAPQLLKQHDAGEAAVVRRLLKSILVGRAHAGVKMLPGVGPKIIEVKAILHGHKRIMGCLDGRRVRLLYMIDIKADVSSYAKRIPADLCQ